MNLRLSLLVVAIAATPCSAWSQNNSRPRPEVIISPDISPDRSVTFRMKAPDAKAVSVRGQWADAPLPLARNDAGLWTGTATAVQPGVWEYSIVVDGLSMVDPSNAAIKPMRSPRTSILHIPGTPSNPWDFQDVPHGTVHQHSYLSKALQQPRELCVYTPPGYETSTVRYPLLVLQHGSGDGEKTWTAHGKAHWILDNLIAAGKARPMVILMIDGHQMGMVPRDDVSRRAVALEAFGRELLEDAVPLVDAQYRVLSGSANRGIVGHSMGGWQSLSVGLSHLDQFAWVGSFSGGVPDDSIIKSVLTNPADTNGKLRLLWIGVGKDDFLLAPNEKVVTQLKEGGITHEWRLTEGGHTWPVWRQYLADFVPLLFQPKP